MGAYINPEDKTKEQWLEEHGKQVEAENVDYDELRNQSKLPVCLVDNGPFTAAAIGYTKEEWERFAFYPDDPRPKVFYVADEADLHTVSPILKDYMDNL